MPVLMMMLLIPTSCAMVRIHAAHRSGALQWVIAIGQSHLHHFGNPATLARRR